MPRRTRVAAIARAALVASTSAPPGGLDRPKKDGEWWSVSQEDWDIMNRARKTQVAHTGNIMEGEDGVMAKNRCLR